VLRWHLWHSEEAQCWDPTREKPSDSVIIQISSLRMGLRFLSHAQCAAEVAPVLSCYRQLVVVELRFIIYFIKNKSIKYFLFNLSLKKFEI
jgi:hypothetical protein